jgi:50S ribosomal subunit-associated GTPase HflX
MDTDPDKQKRSHRGAPCVKVLGYANADLTLIDE